MVSGMSSAESDRVAEALSQLHFDTLNGSPFPVRKFAMAGAAYRAAQAVKAQATQPYIEKPVIRYFICKLDTPALPDEYTLVCQTLKALILDMLVAPPEGLCWRTMAIRRGGDTDGTEFLVNAMALRKPVLQ